jgi:outer membrane protein assembly factor BamB
VGWTYAKAAALGGGLVGEGLGGEAGGVLAGVAAGSRVGGYLLEEQVGAGGMAVVFRARDERLRRLVALKVLGPGLSADEDFRRRFIRESRAAAAVEDPHIIPVHEAGQDGGVLFIAMRYVSGGDVRSLLRREGPLSAARVAAIISPVASALDSAHAAGLVHRDVKPANMLIDMRPERPEHVYLSDFGLSKGALSVGLTGSGHFLGTPGYSAPEQIQGRPVDGRADQYALACTAFELLCGMAVFPRNEVLAMMYAHLSEPPPPLASRRPGTPRAADEVLARALAKDPAGRYTSCGDFADALRGAFGLDSYHASRGTGLLPGAPSGLVTQRSAGGGYDPSAGFLTQSAGLRDLQQQPGALGYRQELTGSWPATQPRARHARDQAGQAHPTAPPSRALGGNPSAARQSAGPQPAAPKRAVTRRAILGLTAAATAGLAAGGWELAHRTTPSHRTQPRSSTQPGGTLIWTTPIPNNGIGWGPMVTANAIYVGDAGAGTPTSLYALGAGNGHILWRHPGAVEGQQGVSGVTISGKAIYTLTAINLGSVPALYGLAAYDAMSGSQLWVMSTAISASDYGFPEIYGPTIVDDTLYLTDGNGKLYAIDSANGKVLWTFLSGGISGGLAASGGTVYLASRPNSSVSEAGEIYAIRSGQLVWRAPSLGTVTEGPIVMGELVYVISDAGGVSAFHTGTGDKAWGFGAATGSWNYRPVSGLAGEWIAGGVVYADDGVGNLHALSADDGAKIWQAPAGHVKFGVATAKATVFISNGYGDVYALRVADGKTVWHLATGNPRPSITVAGDILYVSSNNLYALRAADGKQLWSFPESVSTLAVAPGVVYVNTGTSLHALRA